MIVCLTQTIGPTMGSKVATPGLGFLYAQTMGGYLGEVEPNLRVRVNYDYPDSATEIADLHILRHKCVEESNPRPKHLVEWPHTHCLNCYLGTDRLGEHIYAPCLCQVRQLQNRKLLNLMIDSALCYNPPPDLASPL